MTYKIWNMYFISIYNQLIQINVNVDKSWANIMVLEKQRYDEIPKLVDICNAYMKYEQATIEKVTLARTKFLDAQSPSQVAKAGADLGAALKTLFAVSENYPELKANQNFKQLQENLIELNNQLVPLIRQILEAAKKAKQEEPVKAVEDLDALKMKGVFSCTVDEFKAIAEQVKALPVLE